MDDFSGQSTGRYHIVEKLGQGGMAVVYRAFDTTLEMDVAIKFLRMDRITPEMLDKAHKRFKIEAQKTAQLMHANIVQVIDYGEFQETPFLVMRYISDGKTLKSLLVRPISYQKAIQILLPIAHALEAAHQRGVIHRDVKPSNILITEDGTPLLSDFGIAKILADDINGEGLTTSGVAIGTPEYMAPEQWEGKPVDERVDVYSLGVVLFEMITGRPPYKADTVPATMVQILRDPLPRPQKWIPDLPEQVEHVLFKALAKDPQDRYSSMRLFSEAMERIVNISNGELYHQPVYTPISENQGDKRQPLEENEDDTGEVTIDQFGDVENKNNDLKVETGVTVSPPVNSQNNSVEGSNITENEETSSGNEKQGEPSSSVAQQHMQYASNERSSSSSHDAVVGKSEPNTGKGKKQPNWKKQKWLAFILAALVVVGLIELVSHSIFPEEQLSLPETNASTAFSLILNSPAPTEAPKSTEGIAFPSSAATPAPMPLGICDKSTNGLCISAFTQADYSGVLCILRQSEAFSGSYGMMIDGIDFTCTTDSNYPNRLFCSGPGIVQNKMITVELYSLYPRQLIATGEIVVFLPTSTPTESANRYP